LVNDPRVTLRRPGSPDPEGTCVVYWMQRAQRANDNAALTAAIEAGNFLRKPVAVFLQLVPRSHHANFRHYQFLVEGLGDIASGLQKKNVKFILRRFPEHGLTRFCGETRPCLIIGDENPLKEPEDSKAKIARQVRLPFWTVDADVIVPTRLLGKEHYAARTIRPKIHALLPEFLRPVKNPSARFHWPDSVQVTTLVPDRSLIDDFPIDRSLAPSA
jgi:deoxyribodipyrimidine photo-lyase